MIVLLILGQSLYGQITYKRIVQSLQQYEINSTPEKVYIHTDKDQYTNGETIWFKSYLVNGITHKPSAISKVLYVELVDPVDSVLVQKKLYVDSVGTAGNIKLDYDFKEGIYLLRAYTAYMRNAKLPAFFQKEIPIWYQKIEKEEIRRSVINSIPKKGRRFDSIIDQKHIVAEPVVQFYPEGGNLVAGIDNIIAIKTTDSEGDDRSLSGTIEDQDENTVGFFKTFKYGLGRFNFIPEKGKEYFVKISIGTELYKYPIQPIIEKGYTLQVFNKNDRLQIKIQSNTEETLFGALLLGHMRGKAIFERKIDIRKNSHTIDMKVADLPPGIVSFTLFLPGGIPICNRLVFVHENEQLPKLVVHTDKKQYKKKETVEIRLKLTDTLEANLSLSVSQKPSNSIHPLNTIRSWFLLDTDLKNNLENSNYFLSKFEQAQRKYLLDIFLITQQWDRFSWQDLIGTGEFDQVYSPEKGLYVRGTTSLIDKPLATKQTEIRLNIMESTIFQDTQKTDTKGRFEFGPYIIKDSVKLFLEAKIPLSKTKIQEKNISIQLDSFWNPVPLESSAKRIRNELKQEEVISYLQAARKMKIADFKENGINRLDEVFIKAKNKTQREQAEEEINAFTRHGRADFRVFPDSLPWAGGQTVLDLLRTIPGLRILGNPPNQTIVTTRPPQRQPLLLIDENRVTLDDLNNFPVSAITFIDFLSFSPLYGPNSDGGTVLIYTHKDFEFMGAKRVFPGTANIIFPGFDTPKDFFEKELAALQLAKKPNYKTTLFWDPSIKLNKMGGIDMPIRFICGDNPGTYLIKVEGVTQAGHLISSTASFEIIE